MKSTTIFLVMFASSFVLQGQNGSTILGTNTSPHGKYYTFIGYSVGTQSQDASAKNTGLGYYALNNITNGYGNTCIGANSGVDITEGSYNTFLGLKTGNNNTIGENNTFLGNVAGEKNTSGNSNTFVGSGSGRETNTGNYNAYFGNQAGRLNTTGSNNVALGFKAGYSGGSNNVFLGNKVGFYETSSNKLYIDNSDTDQPLIHGDFEKNALTLNGSVGVGEAIPQGAKIPNDIQLYVNNRIVQKNSGEVGGFNEDDIWASFGKSFAPPGLDIPNIYGMFNVWGNRSFTSGVKEGQHGVVSWGGPAARLDFDYLNNDNESNTFMSITAAGNVGIGTTNPRRYKLDVSGDISSTGIFTDSDNAYKQNVEPLQDALAKIEALQGVSYEYKNEKINNIDFTEKTGRHCGLIAQEVEQVLPELIKKDAAGYYAVNYGGIIPVLIEAMKEQQKNITNQTEIITELKTKLEKMETLIKSTTPKLADVENDGIEQSIVLKQNTPNPTNQLTNIAYVIPADLTKASLIIFDIAGKQMAEYPVSGSGSLQIDVKNFANGTYTYAVVANGQNLVNRKMIVQH